MLSLSHRLQIAEMNEQVNQTESSQKELDQNLEYIESQQTELSNLLDALEGEVNVISKRNTTPIGPVDEQRLKT